MDALFDSLVKQAKRSNEIRQEIQHEKKTTVSTGRSDGCTRELDIQRLSEITDQIPIQLDW